MDNLIDMKEKMKRLTGKNIDVKEISRIAKSEVKRRLEGKDLSKDEIRRDIVDWVYALVDCGDVYMNINNVSTIPFRYILDYDENTKEFTLTIVKSGTPLTSKSVEIIDDAEEMDVYFTFDSDTSIYSDDISNVIGVNKPPKFTRASIAQEIRGLLEKLVKVNDITITLINNSNETIFFDYVKNETGHYTLKLFSEKSEKEHLVERPLVLSKVKIDLSVSI